MAAEQHASAWPHNSMHAAASRLCHLLEAPAYNCCSPELSCQAAHCSAATVPAADARIRIAGGRGPLGAAADQLQAGRCAGPPQAAAPPLHLLRCPGQALCLALQICGGRLLQAGLAALPTCTSGLMPVLCCSTRARRSSPSCALARQRMTTECLLLSMSSQPGNLLSSQLGVGTAPVKAVSAALPGWHGLLPGKQQRAHQMQQQR